ncbi:MAG TPA: hypothetical protein VJ761_05315 [Ktedonobacteraceae bacterium]|nr:hypothetical protein [Ktedonobacteraceae bacterium]
MRKYIYATATAGPPLALCLHCKKVKGDYGVVLQWPFYPEIGVEHPVEPEMLNIVFRPDELCACPAEKSGV